MHLGECKGDGTLSAVPYTSSGCLMLLKVTGFACAHGVYAAGGCSEEHLLLEMTIAHNSAE